MPCITVRMRKGVRMDDGVQPAMSAPPQPQGWYPDPSERAQALAPEALAPQPKDDPFYTYSGSKPLESIKPGTVLATSNA